MRRNLQTQFNTRQYMLSKDFEIYYYSDYNLSKIEGHTHNYYEFYFFLEGDVQMEIDKSSHKLQSGDIMLIPPNIKHRAVIRNNQIPYRRFVFWISQDYCKRLLELSPDYIYLMQYVQISKEFVFHNDFVSFNAIQFKVFRLIEEMQGNKFGRAEQLLLCVNDLILHLNRVVYEQKNPPSIREEQSLYQRISQYIEEHLEDDLSLEQLANKFYVSKYHIAHIFKNNIGISIHQFITKKRLSACKEAILGNTNITEAYLMFGFGDYSSFYRAFKKEYGLSPKEYRDSIPNI